MSLRLISKPCVKMLVFTRHMASHVSTSTECEISYKWDVFVEEGGGSRKGKEKGRKGEKGKGEKKEKKGKGKEREKEEGGRWFLAQFTGVPTIETRWTKE